MGRRSAGATGLTHLVGGPRMRTARLLRGRWAAPSRWLPLVLVAAGSAGAQVPGGALPGQVERQFQSPPEPRAAPPSIAPSLPEPDQGPPPDAAKIRFVLKAVRLEGLTVHAPGAFDHVFAQYVGRQVAVANLYSLARVLTAQLRNEGYILTRVVVPAQEIEDGVARLQVVEGFVDRVSITGPGAQSERVQRLGERIRAARPLTAQVLERYLLLLNDLPGVTARATLAPSPATHAGADLAVVLAHKPVAAGLSVDNRGSSALGPGRLLAELDLNGVLGGHEHLGFKVGSSLNGELAFAALGAGLPLGDEGGRLNLGLTASRARPQLSGARPPLLETESTGGSIGYSHPVLRARSHNLTLRASLTAHDGRTELDGTRFSHDRVRALRLGATWDRADSLRGITLVDLEVSHGLNMLGASRNGAADLSRAGGRVDFTRINLYAARLQSLAGRWSVLAAVSLQHAVTDLLSSELFAYGGDPFGRAYDAARLVGDSGTAARLELRYTRPREAALGYTAYAFYDWGQVRRRHPVAEPAVEAAASAGLGLRLEAQGGLSGFAEVAWPLSRGVAPGNERSARGHFGLAWRY